MATKTARQAQWHGMNWCRPARRLALYLRDGLACVWCVASVEEDGVKLSLDHVIPYCRGGTNENANLLTCCRRCNSSRGSRSVAAFARVVAAYLNHGVQAVDIVKRVRASQRRTVPLTEAKELIARRGGLTAALNGKD